jgi:hypothetical protein
VIELTALLQVPGWSDAMKRLQAEWREHSNAARTRAQRIRREFTGRRGTMVVNVVVAERSAHGLPALCVILYDQRATSPTRGEVPGHVGAVPRNVER